MNKDPEHQAQWLLSRHPELLNKIQQALECERDIARLALLEVLRFLQLIASANKVLTPSHRVDLAWHELILFTRAYQKLCEEQYGRFIHHEPGGEEEVNHSRFHHTLRLYRSTFGAPPPWFWCEGQDADPSCSACEAS